MFKIIVPLVLAIGCMYMLIFSSIEAESGEKFPYEEWVCSDCGDENPFWYSLCGGCGKFYW